MSAEQKSLCFTFRSMPHLDPLKALVSSIFVSVTITVLFIVPYAGNERYLGSTALRGLMVAVLACFFVANLAVCTFRITGRGQPESTPPRTWLVFPLLATIGISAAHIPIGDTTLGAVPLAIITLYGGFVANLIFVIGPLFSTREHAAMARKGNSPFILCKILFFFFQAVYFEMTRRFATPLIGVLFPCGCILMEFMVILVIRIAICRFYFEPKSAFVERLASGPSDRLGGERLVTTPSEIDSAPAVASIAGPKNLDGHRRESRASLVSNALVSVVGSNGDELDLESVHMVGDSRRKSRGSLVITALAHTINPQAKQPHPQRENGSIGFGAEAEVPPIPR